MPAVTVPVDALAMGPGYLFWAPLGTAIPANTVTGSVFTDAWPVAWLLWGVTEEGHVFNRQLNTEPVEVAEYLNPISNEPTNVQESVEFSAANIHATNFKRAMNGGTITVTGTGATTLSKYEPPTLAQITRAMLGWEGLDNTERWVAYKCLQTGQTAIPRRKGANKAVLPMTWTIEQPTSGNAWEHYGAGTKRG